MGSICQGRNTLALAASLLLLISIQSLLSWHALAQNADDRPKGLRIQLPKIFDWSRFKVAFQKVYANPRDEIVRRKLFIGNALKTFFHNIAFRLGKRSYFLSINQFSDKTPDEIKKMYSGMKLGKDFENLAEINDRKNSQRIGAHREAEKLEGAIDLDLDQLQQELERIVEEKQPGFEILAKELGLKIDSRKNRLNSGLRKMRTSAFKDTTRQMKTRKGSKKASRSKMEINDFRSLVDGIAPQESSKFVKRVPPTNDQYQPVELFSQASSETKEGESLTDEQISASKWAIPGAEFVRDQLSKLSGHSKDEEKFEDATEEDVEELFEDASDSKAFSPFYDDDDDADLEVKADDKGQVSSPRKGDSRYQLQAFDEESDKPGLEDKRFVDWRESGCLTVIRDQKDCGSCYAFATIALLEFLHCQQTGKLVPFSEQYMVDCGKSHVTNINGCDGSDVPSMATFVFDWGVELRSNYPYMAKETRCPYRLTEMRRAGFKKPLFETFKYVFQRSRWPGLLQHGGPLMGVIRIPSDFSFYGGMIHDGLNCLAHDGSHAMLLVGHGIEDGEEYWLYRNSHGYYWGENGYFKLSKDAEEICFGPHTNTKFRF